MVMADRATERRSLNMLNIQRTQGYDDGEGTARRKKSQFQIRWFYIALVTSLKYRATLTKYVQNTFRARFIRCVVDTH